MGGVMGGGKWKGGEMCEQVPIFPMKPHERKHGEGRGIRNEEERGRTYSASFLGSAMCA